MPRKVTRKLQRELKPDRKYQSVLVQKLNNKSMLDGKKSILMITHYDRLLELIKQDFVHILSDGKIAKTGDYSLALELDEKGFEALGINNANS